MLRANFIRVPAPGSPACTTNDAHFENGSFTSSNALSVAPTIVASSPFLAARPPPLTGASTTWMPCGSSSSASSTAVVSLIVEWIAMTVPGLALAASSPTTSRTCSSSSTVTLMTSAAATSATLSASGAPFSASGVIASVRTSYTMSTAGPVHQPRRHRRAHLAQTDVAELDLFVSHGNLSQDLMIWPPSTLKICPVIHDA